MIVAAVQNMFENVHVGPARNRLVGSGPTPINWHREERFSFSMRAVAFSMNSGRSTSMPRR